MHRRLTTTLLIALSCPGHAEPARRPEPAPVIPMAEPGHPEARVSVDAMPYSRRPMKTIVANGSGRGPRPVESYAISTHMKAQPNA